jgi:hypothetical protein
MDKKNRIVLGKRFRDEVNPPRVNIKKIGRHMCAASGEFDEWCEKRKEVVLPKGS